MDGRRNRSTPANLKQGGANDRAGSSDEMTTRQGRSTASVAGSGWAAESNSIDEDMEKLFREAEEREHYKIKNVIGSLSLQLPTDAHHYDENDYQSHRKASFPCISHHSSVKSTRSSARKHLPRVSESVPDNMPVESGSGGGDQPISSSQPVGSSHSLQIEAKNDDDLLRPSVLSTSASTPVSPQRESGQPPFGSGEGDSENKVGFYVGEKGGSMDEVEQGKAFFGEGNGDGTNTQEKQPLLVDDVVTEDEPVSDMSAVGQRFRQDRSHSLQEPMIKYHGSPHAQKPKVKFQVGSLAEVASSDDGESHNPELQRHTAQSQRRHRLKHSHGQKTQTAEDASAANYRPRFYSESNHTAAPPVAVTSEEDEMGSDSLEVDESEDLLPGDLELVTSHRFEDARGIRRHKVQAKNSVSSFVHLGSNGSMSPPTNGTPKHFKPPLPTMSIPAKKFFDKSPHEIFVELDELIQGEGDLEWHETARWIKYEEDVEEGAGRWGKPHVAPLSFHSLLNLRKCIEQGTVLLDLEERDLPGIAYRVVDHMVTSEQIKPEDRGAVMRALLLRHRHVNEQKGHFQFSGLRRNTSGYNSLLSLQDDRAKPQKSVSFSIPQSSASVNLLNHHHHHSYRNATTATNNNVNLEKNGFTPVAKDHVVSIDAKDLEVGFSPAPFLSSQSSAVSSTEDVKEVGGDHHGIMRKIPDGAEATTVLVGALDFLEQPTIAFVRLATGTHLTSLLEVPIPVRFMFVLLGPVQSTLDYHEIGRSISTLMSNRTFHEAAYKAEERKDLLHSINEFLDDSIVLPPGDWHSKSLLPFEEIQKKSLEIRARKKQQSIEREPLIPEVEKSEKVDGKRGGGGGGGGDENPLQRTGVLFGGLINDIKRRYPWYWRDIVDGFNIQCLAAIFFIYFAALSGAISFGGLLSDKTTNLIGTSETLVATSLCGILFSLFSAQPLMIIGVTGPVLLFDESLFRFCSSAGLEFLAVRFWVGVWTVVIAAVVVALESSFLLRYFTRFTEEIFTTLISIIYIYEAMAKLNEIFHIHPLLPGYCSIPPFQGVNETSLGSSLPTHQSSLNQSTFSPFFTRLLASTGSPNALPLVGMTSSGMSSSGLGFAGGVSSIVSHEVEGGSHHVIFVPVDQLPKNQPNTALLSMILMLSTFGIAFYLRQFRNGQYLGRTIRRALGDFGVPIAIILMVAVDYAISDTYTQKLSVPEGLSPSDPEIRGWLIAPLGRDGGFSAWMAFGCVLPAMLFFILLFMETQIGELIMNKKERKLIRGSGYHLDILLLSVLNFGSAVIGGPWMSAAIVRAISHSASLTVMSRTHAPGEQPHILLVREQRISNLMVSVLIGASVMMSGLLRLIPVSVLFGIFIYMGVCSMAGVQFLDRLRLFLMPVKHHPNVSYVAKVRTLKMHAFTLVQLACFVTLWVVKSSQVAIALPFVLVLLIPIRLQLSHFFTQQELTALDGSGAQTEEKDEADFYEAAHLAT